MLKALLIEARQGAGMTQEELATELGVSRQTVNGWEQGRHIPSRAHLSRLGDLLMTPEQETDAHRLAADAERAR